LDAVALALGIVVLVTFAAMGYAGWRSAHDEVDPSYRAALSDLDRLAPPRLRGDEPPFR
jgi:hypothetical protein